MKNEIKSHWNRIASEYDKGARGIIYSDREKIAWQKIFMQVLAEDSLKILDVGTGPGIVTNLLTDLGHDVIGLDISDSMLKSATKNSQDLHHFLDFVQGDGENLPFESDTFDVIVNRYVLWTLPDPKKALAEWKRALKPGGRLIVIDGTWHRRDKNKPVVKRMWQHLSFMLVMLAERRVPHYQDLNGDIRNQLWSSKLEGPKADEDLLKSLGYRQIQIIDSLNRKLLTTMDYLKYGHTGERFLISGVK